MPADPRSSSRRDFLTGRAARREVERAGDLLADELTAEPAAPEAGDTIRLATRAMACEFALAMNPGPPRQVMTASDALDRLHPLERTMTVHQPEADLVRVNQHAAEAPVPVDDVLFDVLLEAARIADETRGCFDPTSGPLIALWKRCRDEGRIPRQDEIDACRDACGFGHVVLDEDARTVRFDRPGVELNLGGIGKGYALDVIAGELVHELPEFLFHGGRSSILARGDHAGQGGWPVGIVDPLTRNRRLATLLLRDRALSTSGSSVQFFRHGGRRYGHILDPRTGWPAEGLLSVAVLAPTAAEADALSTAFFVGGVEIAREYCDNHPQVGALLIPPPKSGRALEPVVLGIPDDVLFFAPHTSRAHA